MAHQLPPLPYDAAALEPHIDAQTMQIHHGKHHAAYVNNLNAAIEKHPDLGEQERRGSDQAPGGRARRHPRGGPQQRRRSRQPHDVLADHGPGKGGAPTGKAGDAIKGAFGSFDAFKEQMNKGGAGRFGSGWVWLVSAGGKLTVESTPNQDNPMMDGKHPVFGIDVWEHAYYLKYQNRRPDYLAAWWNVINWDEVSKRLP